MCKVCAQQTIENELQRPPKYFIQFSTSGFASLCCLQIPNLALTPCLHLPKKTTSLRQRPTCKPRSTFFLYPGPGDSLGDCCAKSFFHLDRGIVILKTMVRPPNPHHTSKSLGYLGSMAIRTVPSRWMSCPLVRDPQSPALHNGVDECLQASNPKLNLTSKFTQKQM